jgi:hypothetical protein
MMKTQNFVLLAVIVPILLFALALTAITGGPAATAAPMAAPTPVSVTRPSSAGFVTVAPFTAVVLTADTTSSCYDIPNYNIVDVLYSIDQGTVNTVTLTSKWSIDGVTLVSGNNIVATNAADATDMTQLQAFGRYFCVLADVSNTNAVTLTVQAMAK